MPRRRLVALAIAGLVLAGLLASCAKDDGAGVRSAGGGSSSGGGSASASGAASGSAGSGSASGSGLSAGDVAGTSSDPLVQRAVARYTTYVKGEVVTLVTNAKVFTDAVRAGDVKAAKAAYAPSRVHFETIEPIAGLVADIDGAVDGRVDDFASVNDPNFTGWHRIEYLLWEKGTTEGAAPFADKLDAELAKLQREIATVKITPLAVTKGAAELIDEVSEAKITGEEDRYSRTDLWDINANVEGSRKGFDLMKPALDKANAKLADSIQAAFGQTGAALDSYRQGDGFKAYDALTGADRNKLKAILAGLSEDLAKVPGELKLG